jgi:hypothetical protein
MCSSSGSSFSCSLRVGWNARGRRLGDALLAERGAAGGRRWDALVGAGEHLFRGLGKGSGTYDSAESHRRVRTG